MRYFIVQQYTVLDADGLGELENFATEHECHDFIGEQCEILESEGMLDNTHYYIRPEFTVIDEINEFEIIHGVFDNLEDADELVDYLMAEVDDDREELGHVDAYKDR